MLMAFSKLDWIFYSATNCFMVFLNFYFGMGRNEIND